MSLLFSHLPCSRSIFELRECDNAQIRCMPRLEHVYQRLLKILALVLLWLLSRPITIEVATGIIDVL